MNSGTTETISTTLLSFALITLSLVVGVFLVRNYRLSKRLLFLAIISVLSLILGLGIIGDYRFSEKYCKMLSCYLYEKQQVATQNKDRSSMQTPIPFYPQSLNFWDSVHLHFENPHNWKFFNQNYKGVFLFRFKYPKIFTLVEGDQLIWLTKDKNLPGYIMIAQTPMKETDRSENLPPDIFVKISTEKNKPFYKIENTDTKTSSENETYWISYIGFLEGVAINVIASKQLPERVVLNIIRSIEAKSEPRK